jgi:ribosomal protein S27AE
MRYFKVTKEEMKAIKAKSLERKKKRMAKRKEFASFAKLTGQPPKINGWTYWRDKCDRAWSDLIIMTAIKKRQRFCPSCGTGTPYAACHKVPRSYLATRWLPENGYYGCRGCNYREVMQRGLRTDDWFDRVFGGELMEALRFIARTGETKFSVSELMKIHFGLRKKTESLK